MVDFDNNPEVTPENSPPVGVFEFMREREDGDFDIIMSVDGVEEFVRILPASEKDFPNGRPDPEQVANHARQMRNGLLASTDMTQISDYPTEHKAAWATYRAALRSLPEHSNWPDLRDEDWPTAPEDGVLPY
mgnify:CR=1 FL=1